MIVSPDGRLTAATPLPFTRPTKAILTAVVDDDDERLDLAAASELAWAKDGERTEEDQAWASLQEETSS